MTRSAYRRCPRKAPHVLDPRLDPRCRGIRVERGVRGVQTTPPTLIVVTAAIALVLVTVRPLWLVTRHLITQARGIARARRTRLVGRRLSGIRLHSDTSGVTVSSGNPRGGHDSDRVRGLRRTCGARVFSRRRY